MLNQQKLIDYNTRRHDQIAKVEGDQSYDARHIEIFNPTEQRRLRRELDKAMKQRRTQNPRILDFGCGTGNLTSKLLGDEREVCAADVSSGMCELVKRRFANASENGGLVTETLTGKFPLPFPDNHFGFIATYSVLHHVPDYETAVRELVRVLDHGGILYIDHEASTRMWSQPLGLRLYRLLQQPWLGLPRLAMKLTGTLKPEISQPRNMDDLPNEGDIHIFAHDHIEWDVIEQITSEGGVKKLPTKDYLSCNETSHFPIRHMICKWLCDNTSLFIGRKATNT